MENNIDIFVEQIKNNEDDELKKCIEEWFEKIRSQSMKIGATYISAAIYGIIEKHIIKNAKPSLRSYKRMTDDIIKIISVQLNTQQNDSEKAITEETSND